MVFNSGAVVTGPKLGVAENYPRENAIAQLSKCPLGNGNTRTLRHSVRLSVRSYKGQSSCRRAHAPSIVEEPFAWERLSSDFAPTSREDDDVD